MAGNAEAEIDGRTVYIGTCVGGVHTYHVHLEEPDVIVSLNDVGEAGSASSSWERCPTDASRRRLGA